MVTNGNKENAENADKYACEKCDFTCSKYSNYVKHLTTRKHGMVTLMVTNGNKNAESGSGPGVAPPPPPPITVLLQNTCTKCNKRYSHRSGLSRHKKTCLMKPSIIYQSSDASYTSNGEMKHKDKSKRPTNQKDCVDHDTDTDYDCDHETEHDDADNDHDTDHDTDTSAAHDTDDAYDNHEHLHGKHKNTKMSPKDMSIIMLELIKSNTQLQTQMLEICKSSQSFNNVTGNTINDNTTINSNNNSNNNNNTFNMNFFLNEQCKDAMNMKDFVNSIQLNLTDLENVGRLGYVEGMSNILIDNLKKTDIYKRPVHCSDIKRETLYVKDDNKWEREGPEHPKMVNAVLAVEQKNVALVSEWAKAHPRCMNSHTRENETYFKLSKVATDGEKDGNIAKVIRKVAKRVAIDKEP
jgi:hypothetical protein